jgi:hypothetical protein
MFEKIYLCAFKVLVPSCKTRWQSSEDCRTQIFSRPFKQKKVFSKPISFRRERCSTVSDASKKLQKTVSHNAMIFSILRWYHVIVIARSRQKIVSFSNGFLYSTTREPPRLPYIAIHRTSLFCRKLGLFSLKQRKEMVPLSCFEDTDFSNTNCFLASRTCIQCVEN